MMGLQTGLSLLRWDTKKGQSLHSSLKDLENSDNFKDPFAVNTVLKTHLSYVSNVNLLALENVVLVKAVKATLTLSPL